MAEDLKWWHVADTDVEELVSKLGGIDPFKQTVEPFRPTVVTAAARPPKPRGPTCSPRPPVANSPRPPVANSPRLPVTSSAPTLPRALSSERPHVAPGTPLMTHRTNYTPRDRDRDRSRPGSARNSRPSSARNSCGPQKNDGKITLYVLNVHSGDKLVLRVCPDLQVGYQHEGEEPSCNGVEQSGDGKSQPCLKNEISCALGIDASQIRLMYKGSPLANDDKTLEGYGVEDGDMMYLRIHRTPSVGRNEVVLSCAAKKYMVHGEREKDDMLCMRAFAFQSPSAQARLNKRVVQNGAALMPKWVSQEKPNLFAPVGVAIDGHGGDTPFQDFSSQGIWIAPVDHPNQRGQNQYGVQRVREGIHKLGGA